MENEKCIEQILNSLDGMQRAEANPFLFQKIKNRMQQKDEPIISLQMGWRLALALATVIALNMFTFQHFKNEHNSNRASVINSEYSISLPDTY
ncbi:MAG: hypothetical protein C4330_09060 [Chitinophagaceae bacterium]